MSPNSLRRIVTGVLLLLPPVTAYARQTPCGDMENVVARVLAPGCFERLAGPATYKRLQDAHTIVPASPWQPRLDRIADTLNRVAPPNSGQLFRILVLHVPQVNAFSVPGGDIYVNEGLLDSLRLDEELRGALCHEAAHALRHHTAQKIQEQIGLGRAAKTLSRYVHQADNYFDFPAYFVGQRFSRDLEEEADVVGSDLCAAAGYNPWGLVALLRHTPDVAETFEAVSDHPTNVHRIENLVAHFKAYPATFGKWSDPAAAQPAPPSVSGTAESYSTFADAYIEGIKRGRFVVILFHSQGPNADALRGEVNQLERDPAFAAYVVFGDGDVAHEVPAYNIAADVGVKKLPTVSLFLAQTSVVAEIGRVEGYHTAADLRVRLLRQMCDASRRRRPGAPQLGAGLRVTCEDPGLNAEWKPGPASTRENAP